MNSIARAYHKHKDKQPHVRVEESTVSVKEDVVMPSKETHYKYRYFLGLRFQYEGIAQELEEVDFMKEIAIKRMCNEVYGDYRKPLHEAMYMIKTGNQEKALEAINNVLTDMSEVR